MSAIFYHDDNQYRKAIDAKEVLEKKENKKIYTAILPFEKFYGAEGYHQKYYLQLHTRLYGEVKKIYNSFDELVNSTLAARINGYLKGNGSIISVEEEMERSSIAESQREKIITMLKDLGR